MKVQFWGVRGDVPTPGEAYLRYGGNTCCTAIHGSAGELIVLDAGTGFCQLGDELMAGDFGRGQGNMVLLISHSYWDHMLGLPFPGVVHRPGNQLTIYGPDSTLGSLEMVYDGVLSPVYSPVYGLAHIGATHRFYTINTKPFSVGNLEVQALSLSQRKHSPIWGYRISEGDRSVVYITDVRYTDETIRQRAQDFAHGAGMLIHSAPYTRSEQAADYGHSRVEDAIEVALAAGVQRLMLFHHAPTRTDDQLDQLVSRAREIVYAADSDLLVDAAREGGVEDI